MHTKKHIAELEKRWKTDPRWKNIYRPYNAETVLKLQGSMRVEHTLARLGAEKVVEHASEKSPLFVL